MEEVQALLSTIILLVVGILAVTVTRPLRLSPIVGYLLAGVLIGPHGLGLIVESETTQLLAELGVVFLLFDIGLHFSLSYIWDARRDILGFGPIQVGLCTVAFGMLAFAGGSGLNFAIATGATLALSSTAVAVQTLNERGQQSCPVGVTATAVLIFQDICAIFLLILATSLGNTEISLVGAMSWAVLKAAVAFATTIMIGRYLIGPLFKGLAKSKSEEVFTAVALLIVLMAAVATGGMGLSLTLGAFLGGMIISETPYRHVIQTEVKPFRGLLLGFFFITVGMSLDLTVLMREWAQILVILVLLVSLKATVVFIAALAVRIPLRVAVQLSFLLSQGSEFTFVIFAIPALNSALGPSLSAVLVTAVAASLALTPTLTDLGNKIATWLANKHWQTQLATEVTPLQRVAPVVIFGMGELGRRVADGLEAHGIPYMAIEIDHDHFVKANADGYPVAFGDAGDPRFLETIQMAQRPTIVVTIKRYEISRNLTPILRERYPNLTRFIAVDNDEERRKFEALGMRAIVSRSIPSGLDLAAAVLRAHNVKDEKIYVWMREQQDLALAAA
jgi:monovalent cation:proton antiporter-2 (CPA2) family protein